MSVPLIRREELVGVLNVNETKGQREFSDQDLNALGFNLATGQAPAGLTLVHQTQGFRLYRISHRQLQRSVKTAQEALEDTSTKPVIPKPTGSPPRAPPPLPTAIATPTSPM